MRLCALLLVLAAFLPNAALYLAALRVRRRYPLCNDEEEAVPFAVRVSAFLLECAAANAAVLLSLIGSTLPSRLGDPHAAVRVVVLHGYAQTRGSAAMLARRLTDLGFGVVCFSYSSLRADVPAAAEQLRRLVVDLQKERPGPVHLLGFGLGGLVARYCVRRHLAPGVRRVLTLGTPHLGTLLAPKCPAALARLRPESEFLAQLGAADRAPEQFEATAIQSTFDATILPPENGYYPAAFNVTVRDTGHFSLLFSARIFELIEENLELGA